MTEKKPVFNPQAVPKSGKNKFLNREKKQRKPVFSLLFRRREKQNPDTRTIRFAPRTAQSIFSLMFFGLFLVMCVIVIMTFGRVDTLTRMALSKQVNEEELVTNINNDLTDSEQLKYEGMRLVDRLFTIAHKDEEKQYWEVQLQPFLANGLDASQIGFNDASVDRIVRDVRFIKMKTISQKRTLYNLFYDVRFTEGESWQQVQVSLPVSYEGKELKLIDQPTFTNLEKTVGKNKAVYQENQFTPKGSEVDENQKKKLTEFTQRFFELYVSNDEKLALISNVKGLRNATLMNVEPKTVVKTKNGHYLVQGNYQFYFDKSNPFVSKFTLEIKSTKENYFVTKMNGE